MIKSVQSSNPWIPVMQTVYDIVTKGHGGKLEVETEEGKGTVLGLTLPVH